MKHSVLSTASALVFSLLLVSCSGTSDRPWTEAIPSDTPFVIIPETNRSISSVLEAPYIPFLDDITSAAVPLVAEVEEASAENLTVKSILLYPGTGRQLQPIWITDIPSDLDSRIREHFYRDFAQNEYEFRNFQIHRLHVRDRLLFAAESGEDLLLSESSFAIEEILRAYGDASRALDISELDAGPGSLLINTPRLDRWTELVARVIHRPSLLNALEGSGPVVVRFSGDEENETLAFGLAGQMELPSDAVPAELVAAVSAMNRPLVLDRYISSDAAGFGIFRLQPRQAPPESTTDTTRLDDALMRNRAQYRELAGSLAPEFAIVMYAESGFLSVGEHLYLRRVQDLPSLRNALSRLADRGHLSRDGNMFTGSGRVLAQLIGSELCTFFDYYLQITGDVLVMSRRKGLVELVASDRNRRRVMFYDQNYLDIRSRFPEEVSSLIVTNPAFPSFLDPFLATGNHLSALTGRFDMLALTTELQGNGNSLNVRLETFNTRGQTEPYIENWMEPTGGVPLSGEPVLADIGGSERDEVIFTTENGSVYALASDGTVVLRVNTGGDRPVGSPVVYDWYGTGQNVILQAAGNRLYGWSDSGNPLPRFPFELEEQITTPVQVRDIDRNGLPEAVVGTSDRRLHALDGRGDNIEGWPVSTNTSITTRPLLETFDGSLSVIAFSENAIHVWNARGLPKEGYPMFTGAPLVGSPRIHEDHILGGSADGYLYAAGPESLFQDSLNVHTSGNRNAGDGNESLEAIYVSGSSLSGTPSVHDLRVVTEESVWNETMILTAGSNGSIFLIGENGQLRFTTNVGQPIAESFSPFITDINGDGERDVVALGTFGRLYAWTVSSGERITQLPATGMTHPLVADLDGDGNMELIAHTSEGVRCWTIYGSQ